MQRVKHPLEKSTSAQLVNHQGAARKNISETNREIW